MLGNFSCVVFTDHHTLNKNTGIFIEISLDNLCNSPVKDLVTLGDTLKPTTAKKIDNLAPSYIFRQLVEELLNFTENVSSLIDLVFINKPENVIYRDVISPFIPDLVRYHCPVVLVLKFRKPIHKPFTRHMAI